MVEELDVDRGTEGISCDCSSSSYCYVPAGHVVTGDLTIIRDAKLRSLVRKGPSYTEQNRIDWDVNERVCREAVADYKHKWSTREGFDVRAFSEWEQKVNERIKCKLLPLGNDILIGEGSISLTVGSIWNPLSCYTKSMCLFQLTKLLIMSS